MSFPVFNPLLYAVLNKTGVPGIDSGTVLMLHFDGGNASTTFTDSSSSAHAITAVNSAQLSTASKQFGSASGLFASATTDSITWSDGLTDFSWAGDFTIDFWLNTTTKTTDTQSRHILSGGTSATSVAVAINSSGQMFVGDESGGAFLTGTTDISTGVWFHFAWTRNGANNRIFINGIQEGATTSNSTSWAIASAGVIGKYAGGSGRYNGNLDEFRVSKNVARWVANFTPPTGPYRY